MRKRTPPQIRISQSQSRFNVGVWGRQSGKTTYGLDKILYRPLQGRANGIYWYVLQTHQAAEVAFNRYWDLIRPLPDLVKEKPNESEKFFHLLNGSKVFFKSGQAYEDLRVETLDGAIIDEVRQQAPQLWPRVIRPMLSRRHGWCDFLSTPNGFDHFYDLYEFAKKNLKEWSVFHSPSTEAWWWTKEEIESARATMSEAEFAQEILAEFRDITQGKAYINHGAHNWSEINPFTGNGSKSPHLPIVVGLDFNVGMMGWELGQMKGADSYWFDEIAIRNGNTQQAAKILVEKVRHHASGVWLIGDATGKARKTSASGETDYTIITDALRQANVKFENHTPDSNPAVKDRVNTMNAKLKDANGRPHFFYHPENCPELKKDFDRVVWRLGASNAVLDQITDRERTHTSDAVGYAVYHFDHLAANPVGLMRVIRV